PRSGQGDPRGRAERSAVLSGRVHRRARLVQAGPARAALWHLDPAAHLRAGGECAVGSAQRATEQSRRPRPGAMLVAKGSAAPTAEPEDADPGAERRSFL